MSLGNKWKEFGKNTGKAFSNFGKSIGKTAKVVFTDDKNEVEENGHRKLANAWKDTGKSFGQAGKSLGKAAAGTGKTIVGKDDEEFDLREQQAKDDSSEVVDDKDRITK